MWGLSRGTGLEGQEKMIGDSHSPTWRSSDTGGYAGEIRRAIMIRLLVVALPLSLIAGNLVLLGSSAAASLPVIAIFATALVAVSLWGRSEEHTSELQSLMRISYAVFCLTKKILF